MTELCHHRQLVGCRHGLHLLRLRQLRFGAVLLSDSVDQQLFLEVLHSHIQRNVVRDNQWGERKVELDLHHSRGSIRSDGRVLVLVVHESDLAQDTVARTDRGDAHIHQVRFRQVRDVFHLQLVRDLHQLAVLLALRDPQRAEPLPDRREFVLVCCCHVGVPCCVFHAKRGFLRFVLLVVALALEEQNVVDILVY